MLKTDGVLSVVTCRRLMLPTRTTDCMAAHPRSLGGSLGGNQRFCFFPQIQLDTGTLPVNFFQVHIRPPVVVSLGPGSGSTGFGRYCTHVRSYERLATGELNDVANLRQGFPISCPVPDGSTHDDGKAQRSLRYHPAWRCWDVDFCNFRFRKGRDIDKPLCSDGRIS